MAQFTKPTSGGFLFKKAERAVSALADIVNQHQESSPGQYEQTKDLTAVIFVTGLLGGKNKYKGVILSGAPVVDTGSDFDITDKSEFLIYEECYVYSATVLTINSMVTGRFMGFADDTTTIFLSTVNTIESGKWLGTVRQVVAANRDGYDYLHTTNLLPGIT